MSIPVIDVFRDSSRCTSPLPPPLRGRYNLLISDLGWCIRWIAKILPILVSTYLISVNDQLVIVKQYVTMGSAKEMIPSILLRAFDSLLRIDITLRKHSFQFLFSHREMLHPIPLSYPQIFITFLGFKIFNERCGI